MGKIEVDPLDKLEFAAKKIISTFSHQKLFAFYGAMGAGKTTLIKVMCEVLGVKDYTSSPSFSLINEYRTCSGEIIYHFDFYRIQHIEEAFDLGYEDYFYSGHYCFIEWPERIEQLLPVKTVRMRITVNKKAKRCIEEI
jgi:tRNA threonylcarbamoyladenosine biosynthesis protein TsaE